MKKMILLFAIIFINGCNLKTNTNNNLGSSNDVIETKKEIATTSTQTADYCSTKKNLHGTSVISDGKFTFKEEKCFSISYTGEQIIAGRYKYCTEGEIEDENIKFLPSDPNNNILPKAYDMYGFQFSNVKDAIAMLDLQKSIDSLAGQYGCFTGSAKVKISGYSLNTNPGSESFNESKLIQVLEKTAEKK